MELTDKQKDFILETYDSVCGDWAKRIKDNFPDLINARLIPGRWYKNDNADEYIEQCYVYAESVDHTNKIITGYGFEAGSWVGCGDSQTIWTTIGNWIPVCKDNMFEIMTSEFLRRGFRTGKYYMPPDKTIPHLLAGNLKYFDAAPDCLTDGHGASVYRNGVWGKPLPDKIYEAEMSFHDTTKNEGVEIWMHNSTGAFYEVDVETVRDFDNAVLWKKN